MFKVTSLKEKDLKESYEIEKLTNPTPWTYTNFKSSFEVGHFGLICTHKNDIAGFAIYSPIKPEAHLLNIAVSQKFQKKGAGSILLTTIINQCKAMDIKNIYLEVRITNTKAILFYEKFGFTRDAIRENYYSGVQKEDALLMSKILP